ncbi:hypothetical protein KCU77_g5330, partial [Aureobasidium melanogenum]
MAAGASATGAAISNLDIVEMAAQDLTPKVESGRSDGSPIQQNRICFAPSDQAYNHGSDRLRPLRTMPFDSEIWIGNFDDLGSRVWPHPSFKELLARSLTGDPKFPLPDTVAKDSRFQNPQYEKPSRLETLAFERTQNVRQPAGSNPKNSSADMNFKVVIYPFYVRLSKRTGLQKLFAIVHRHKDGVYKFWKADGTYHESYGLAKGTISIFQSPKSIHSSSIGSLSSSKRQSTSTPTKSRGSAAQLIDDLDDTPLRVIQKARTLAKSRNTETQLVDGLDEDPFRDCLEPPSKRRAVVGSSLLQTRVSDNAKTSDTDTLRAPTPSTMLRARGLSRTPTKQSSCSSVQKPTRTLLQVNEVCMLAYHLTGKDLKLMCRTNTFTIESGEGSLMNSTTDCPFEINEQHAQYVLSSSQKSLKVIMSKSTTWSITESIEDLTGGIILLEFGGVSARDEFIAHLKHMAGMGVRGIGCADDLVVEPMYSRLSKQLARSRKAMFDAREGNENTSQVSAERTQPLSAEKSSEVDSGKAVSCPPALTETTSGQVPASPAASKSTITPVVPSSVGLPQPCPSARTSTTTSISEVVASSTDSPSTQSQETTDTAQPELKVPTSEELMKKELLNLLREVYIKYPSAQDDDRVEEMALLLKAPLLAGDKISIRKYFLSSSHAMTRDKHKGIYTCLSPLSDPGNHGSDPTKSLQVAPFRSESNSIWIGYHDKSSKKYLGVFPSLDEVLDRCRRNSTAGASNISFPRFKKEDASTDCENLILNFIPVETGHSSGSCKKVFLVMYKFFLKDEQMVALVHYSSGGSSGGGRYYFQKTDGTLSKVYGLDTNHGCVSLPPCSTPHDGYDSDISSLTEFDCAEDEDLTDARVSPRLSLRSNQKNQLQEPTNAIVAPSPHTPLLPQGLPAPPRVRGRVVIDMTDEDDSSPIKPENTEHTEHMIAPVPYKTPTATPVSTPSIAPSEDLSFAERFGPDPLAEEYGRITTQICQEYSMRVFALVEVKDLIQRMKQAVKADDRPALCRAYGALQAFLITVE